MAEQLYKQHSSWPLLSNPAEKAFFVRLSFLCRLVGARSAIAFAAARNRGPLGSDLHHRSSHAMPEIIYREPPWQVNKCPQGIYYYNEATTESFWTQPRELEGWQQRQAGSQPPQPQQQPAPQAQAYPQHPPHAHPQPAPHPGQASAPPAYAVPGEPQPPGAPGAPQGVPHGAPHYPPPGEPVQYHAPPQHAPPGYPPPGYAPPAYPPSYPPHGYPAHAPPPGYAGYAPPPAGYYLPGYPAPASAAPPGYHPYPHPPHLGAPIEVRMAGDGVEVEVANVIAVASQAIWLGTVQTRAKRAFEKCVVISERANAVAAISAATLMVLQEVVVDLRKDIGASETPHGCGRFSRQSVKGHMLR
eukprot:s1148_g13.t2